MTDDLVERVAREICCPPHLGHCCPEECSVHHFLPTARAAIAVVLEEAAKVCDGIESERWRLWKTHYDMLDQGRSDGAGDCAAAIRALKESK